MKKLVIIFIMLISLFNGNILIAQNVGIGPNVFTPDNSAGLELQFTNKGLLIPRVNLNSTTDNTTIPSPATSLLVYNNNTSMTNGKTGYWYWDGSKWVDFIVRTTTDYSWLLTGNAGTTEGTNFIGTTDNKYLSIRTNNTEKVRFTTKGQIEIYNTGSSVFIGKEAGSNDDLTSNYNIFIGEGAGKANTSGQYNIANGYQSLYSNTTTDANIANGYQSLYSNSSGTNNIAIGYRALYSNTSGYSNVAINHTGLYSNTTGYCNVTIGREALYYNTTGYNNTGMGHGTLFYNSTGNSNTALGYYAGNSATSGINFTQCTFIGANSSPSTTRTNVTMLGYGIANAQCTDNNQVLLGNTAITKIRAQVTGITSYSDARMKFNVKDDVKGIAFIMKLKPVTYNEDPTVLHKIWGTPDNLVSNIDHSEIQNTRFIGFLAQDVEKAAQECGFDFPGIDIPRNDKEVYSLRYTDFIMPIVKAIQEQQIQIENYESKIKALELENDKLKMQNASLETKLDLLQVEIESIKHKLAMD